MQASLSDACLWALPVLMMGLGFMYCNAPVVFVTKINWKTVPSNLEYWSRAFTEEFVQRFLIAAHAQSSDRIRPKQVSIFASRSDNEFASREAAESALTKLLQGASNSCYFRHPLFPWMAFISRRVSSKAHRAAMVYFGIGIGLTAVSFVMAVWAFAYYQS